MLRLVKRLFSKKRCPPLKSEQHNAIYERAVKILKKYVPTPHAHVQFVCKPRTATSAKVKAKFMVERSFKWGTAWIENYEITARVWTGPWGYRICIYRTYADNGEVRYMQRWYRG